ncbi:hydantoinase/oxoprolinase family protein [Candidatus Nitrosotenuis uzonensis]|uniref:N-methylhydaintoinase A n=1 Tax=Candidatus Nitrosotenuis uzonensis TaxID=1407055 RepID=V6ASX2_9ARCH|nr:hydantoinase/oxoprolinase family protein [Candidatus Nitrosotenuis uzonensis]CDI05664.1 N-methylhydaintoinase A [Candidatus Nitrosotenuis uzonensis]
MSSKRIRIGIDVGGTFTKAIALDLRTGSIVAKATVPTTHTAKRGVSEGIIDALAKITKSGIDISDIELISHSTTQAMNALLEADTAKVGIIAMGVMPEKNTIMKRTRLDEKNSNHNIAVEHAFLDTSHLITESEVQKTVSYLKSKGAQVIVATEAFGVDDPSNELFVMKNAANSNLPSTASHEISGIYGLEIRTLTAAINASVLPKTFEVANFVESAIHDAGIRAPLMIMKGDGGVTNMDAFRTKPILTILSGPAASVAGALLYLKITNGIFVEVGGTSTNICIIKNGKPEIKYVTINEHPTCVRSMDVRVLGVAGGSMIQVKDGHIHKVGPRSAYIAGMHYACFADPNSLSKGKIVLVRPRQSDREPYVAIECENETFAITNTCAANALGMISRDDYAFANQESAKIAMEMLGKMLHVSGTEAAMSVIQTASFEITKTISKIMKEFRLEKGRTQIVGGGGGATVLVPFVAKQMGMSYKLAEHAEVISSIGVASSMLQEEIEVTTVNPTPKQITDLHRKIHTVMIERGAVPESIIVNSEFVSEKSLLRVSAIGNVELDSADNARNVFTQEDAITRASEIFDADNERIKEAFKTDHYFVFVSEITEKKLFNKKNKTRVLVLDKYGRQRLFLKNGKVISGKMSIDELANILDAKKDIVSPQVYLINDLKLLDFSSLISASQIIDAVKQEVQDLQNIAILIDL